MCRLQKEIRNTESQALSCVYIAKGKFRDMNVLGTLWILFLMDFCIFVVPLMCLNSADYFIAMLVRTYSIILRIEDIIMIF